MTLSAPNLAWLEKGPARALGWFDENLSPIQSVGIGLKQVEDTSIIEIQYAVPLNAPISEGHLHFKYISRF